MSDSDWLLLRQHAAALVAEVRKAWPGLTDRERHALAGPFKQLAECLTFLDRHTAEGGRMARPSVPMVQRGLITDCRNATVIVRQTCHPEGGTASTWTAAALLAFSLATVEETL